MVSLFYKFFIYLVKPYFSSVTRKMELQGSYILICHVSTGFVTLVLGTVKRKEDETGMIYRKRAFKVFTAVSTLLL